MEGPSVHRAADQLHSLIGQTIQSVDGNTSQDITQLSYSHIHHVQAVKKRLFILTAACTIVVHFYMYGSYRLNAEKEQTERLLLQCTRDTLYLYNCSVQLFKPNTPQLTELDDQEHDILSPVFQRNAAFESVKQDTRDIASILLDQSIFGGVGNIIKNEALFQAGIHPTNSGTELSSDKAERVVGETIIWTRSWYQHKCAGKHMPFSIYNKKYCPNCGTQCTRRKIGSPSRRTVYCEQCQH